MIPYSCPDVKSLGDRSEVEQSTVMESSLQADRLLTPGKGSGVFKRTGSLATASTPVQGGGLWSGPAGT